MFRNNAMFHQEVVRFAFVFHFLIANHSKSLRQNALYAYSYFEKGCRKKCTRQSRKVLWVVLRSLFFTEILKEWHERPWTNCFPVLKRSSKSRFDSYSVRNSVLITSHTTFRNCRMHFFSDNLSRNSCIQNMDPWSVDLFVDPVLAGLPLLFFCFLDR